LIEKASKDIIICLCANKIDIEERQVSAEVGFNLKKEGKKLSEEYGTLYIEVSAKQNINIEELFQNIALKMPTDETKSEDEQKKMLEKEKLKENRKEYCRSC
jgi:GTPase SAR1 family protein